MAQICHAAKQVFADEILRKYCRHSLFSLQCGNYNAGV